MIDQGAQSVRKRHAADKRNDLFIGGEASPFPVFHKRHEPVRLRGVDGVMYDLRNEQNHHEKHRFDLYGDFRQRNEINQGEKRLAEDMPCGDPTLYRMFARGQYNFSVQQLPMKGKRHPNGYIEHRGKAGRLGRSIYQRYRDFPHYQHEFGHFEADSILSSRDGKGRVFS